MDAATTCPKCITLCDSVSLFKETPWLQSCCLYGFTEGRQHSANTTERNSSLDLQQKYPAWFCYRLLKKETLQLSADCFSLTGIMDVPINTSFLPPLLPHHSTNQQRPI